MVEVAPEFSPEVTLKQKLVAGDIDFMSIAVQKVALVDSAGAMQQSLGGVPYLNSTLIAPFELPPVCATYRSAVDIGFVSAAVSAPDGAREPPATA